MLPLFRPHEGAVHKALREVELAAFPQVLGQRAKDPLQDALLAPALEAAVAGLVGRVALGQVAPGGAGAQDPQDAVEHIPGVPPGPSFAVRPARRIGDQGLQDLPLLVGKVHVRPPASMTARGTLYGPWHIYEIASKDCQAYDGEIYSCPCVFGVGPAGPVGRPPVEGPRQMGGER